MKLAVPIFVSLLTSNTFAGFTELSTPTNPGVFRCVRVTMFTGHLSEEWTSLKVGFVWDRFQVIRIDTMSHPTFVVDLHSFRDRAKGNHVRDYMCPSVSPIMKPPTITFFADVAGPQPTTVRLFYFPPESFVDVKVGAFSVVTLPATELSETTLWSEEFSARFTGSIAKASRSTYPWQLSPPCDLRLGAVGETNVGVVGVQDGFEGRLYPQKHYRPSKGRTNE